MAKDRIDTLANLDPELLKKGVDLVSIGYVHDIILDESHPQAEGNPAYIGAIIYRTSTTIPDAPDSPIVFPLDRNIKNLPVRNERVQIHHFGGSIYYTLIENSANPSVTASETQNADATTAGSTGNLPPPVIDTTVDVTKTPTSNVDISTKLNGYGKYYKGQTGIHNLKMYEGDNLIQSRFGQSIRFSGYNNPDNSFSPTITIRNIENPISLKQDNTKTTEEDVNRDGSIIVFGSNEYQLPFQPGTVSDGGSSDFETKPSAFKSYPSDLKGNQILINSDRLIFSAKTSEMIFYSKKNYGFISDSTLSIDNKLGIEVSVGDNINVLTNDKDINLNTNNGKVNIGNVDLESLVRGETLLGLMEELIDAIVAQIYLTPSGPSATGPTNIADFNAIKSRLKEFLSTLNKTS